MLLCANMCLRLRSVCMLKSCAQAGLNEWAVAGISQPINHNSAYIIDATVAKGWGSAQSSKQATMQKVKCSAQPFISVIYGFIHALHRPYNNDYKLNLYIIKRSI